MKTNSWKPFLIATITFFLVLAIIPFPIFFFKQPFSNKLSDWANAATWFSLFITLITTVFLGYISWSIHENEKRRDNDMKSLLTSIEKPILTFFSISSANNSNIDQWWIKNVGKGAALNIAVAYYLTKEQKWNNNLVNCYSLAGDNSDFQLNWLNKSQVNKLLVFYNDTLTNIVHVSLCYDDKTIISDLDNFKDFYSQDSSLILSRDELLFLEKLQRKRLQEVTKDHFKPSIKFL